MATLTRLELELVTSLAKFQTDMGRAAAVAEKTAKRIESVMNGVGGALAGIGAGLAFKEIIDEAGEAEQALKQLTQTIKSTGGVAGVTVESVTKISGEIQKLTGVSDDAVNSMSSILLTFTKVGKQVFPEATKAIVDMSAKLGTDLKSSAVMVGKALNDPVKGMTALSKAGVSFTQGQKDQIKALVESGNTLKAQQMILRELQTEFGGAAAAARDTLKGAFDALGVAAKDVLENIGSAQGAGLRGGIEFLIQVCEKAAEHGDELAKALQGIAAAATAIIAMKVTQEFAGIAKQLLILGKSGGIWAGVLAGLVGLFVAYRDEQAKVLGTTRTWGDLAKDVFNFVASVSKATINGIIDGFIAMGQVIGDWAKSIGGALQQVANATGAGEAFKGITDALGQIGHWKPSKGILEWANQSNKASKQAGTDWVGGFFAPVQKMADETKKRMDEIGKAAQRGANVKLNAGEGPDVESKAEKKARLAAEKAAKHAEKEHEQDLKSADAILASMKQTNDELQLRLEKNKQLIPELEAQNRLAKLAHLTEKDRSTVMEQINKLAAERKELEKQNAIKDEGDKLKEMLTSYQERTQQIINSANKQNELNVSLKAQAEIDKIIKVGKGENLELVNQILAAAKEQEKVLREQKRLEAMEKYGNQVQDLVDQNKQMALKLAGQEEYLPLLEQEKKIRELMKDDNLSEADKSELANQIKSAASQTVRYNQALENQDRVLKQIKESSGSTTSKIAALQMAFSSGQVNVKQYSELIQDLHKEGFDKLKKDAKEFSDVFVNAMDKGFEKGSKIKDVLKDMGKELLKLGMKKIVAPAIENIFTGIGSKLFGGAYGINGNNPTGLPQAGGMLAGGGSLGTVPTTLAEGPAIVGLLQQIVALMGGNPGAAAGIGGMNLPMSYSDPYNVTQRTGGGLLSRVGGFFGNLFNFGGGASNPIQDLIGNSGLKGGMPSSGNGGLFGALGGVGRTVSNGALGLLRALGTPFFAGGGFLGAGQWGIAGERGPELIYGGNSGMSIIPRGVHGGPSFGANIGSATFPRQTGWDHGRGGVTTGGMISQQDYNWTMAQLFKGQYEEALRNRNMGMSGMGEWQIKNLYDQWQLFEGQAASDTATSMFARNQFETPWTTFNEMSRLDTTGRSINLNSLLPYSVASQNTGGRWGGFTATPIGTSFGGGINLEPGGGYERHISNTAPSDANRASAFSNPFNGGQPSNAPIIASWNSGMGPIRDWQSAVAGVGMGGTISDGLSNMNPAWFDPRLKDMDVTNAPPGSYIDRDGKLRLPPDDNYRPEPGNLKGWENYKYNRSYNYGQYPEATTEDRRMIDAMNKLMSKMPPAAMSFGGLNLPAEFYDMMPSSVQSSLNSLKTGFGIINDANPANLLPQNMMKNAAMNAAGSFLMNPSTWRGNGDFSSWYGQASQTSWFNRSMSPMNFGAAARLFGGRAMRHGGLPHRGEPLIVGEAGAELFVPQSQGRIIPNTAFDSESSGGTNVTINTHTVAPLRVKQQKTPRGLEVIIDDALDAAFQRSGSARDRLQQEYDVRRRPVPRS